MEAKPGPSSGPSQGPEVPVNVKVMTAGPTPRSLTAAPRVKAGTIPAFVTRRQAPSAINAADAKVDIGVGATSTCPVPNDRTAPMVTADDAPLIPRIKPMGPKVGHVARDRLGLADVAQWRAF